MEEKTHKIVRREVSRLKDNKDRNQNGLIKKRERERGEDARSNIIL